MRRGDGGCCLRVGCDEKGEESREKEDFFLG